MQNDATLVIRTPASMRVELKRLASTMGTPSLSRAARLAMEKGLEILAQEMEEVQGS